MHGAGSSSANPALSQHGEQLPPSFESGSHLHTYALLHWNFVHGYVSRENSDFYCRVLHAPYSHCQFALPV